MSASRFVPLLAAITVVGTFGIVGRIHAAQIDPPETIAKSVLDRLDTAWTAANGTSFASNFSSDAQVINIFGQRIEGKSDLTARMQLIFDTIFKGSVHRERKLEYTRRLGDGSILVVSTALVDVPGGPQAPQIHNRQTLLLELRDGAWLITHWQNTPIVSQRQ